MADALWRDVQSRPGDLQGITAAQGMSMGMNMASMSAVAGATAIVSLQEAVVPDELVNDEEYQDIMEDMREECGKVRYFCLMHPPDLSALHGLQSHSSAYPLMENTSLVISPSTTQAFTRCQVQTEPEC